MKIIITGGGGFIGSHVAEAELKRGNRVYALDIADDTKVRHLLKNPNFRYIQKNMLKRNVMDRLIKKCDLIYHLGAIANVQTYVKHPVHVLNTNIDSTRLVLKLAKQYNKKVLFSSSSEVYGKNMYTPWNEDADRVLGPAHKHRWCYSTAKAVGEHYCFGYAKEGLRVVVVRYFNIYGPKLDFIGRGRIMPVFIEKFLNDEPITIVHPGDQTRCFTYITDCVDATIMVAHDKKAEGQAFNIGTDDEISVIRLAEKMKKIGGFTSKIEIVKAETIFGKGYDDVFRRVPDITKIKSFGWKPKVGLDEGLKKTIEYYRKLKEKDKKIKIR